MGKSEIRELMRLKGWYEVDLAAALHVSSDAVYKWLRTNGCPRGPAEVLMGLWLADAREAKENGKLATAK